MKLILFILLFIFSFGISQDVCNGHCLSEEEIHILRESILTLEHDKESNGKIIENLNSQIYMYIRNDSLNIKMIKGYEKQLEFKEDIIKLVKPKWYDNKYLWFFGGMIITSGAVYLAGQID
tara:strand:+ start:990 stop:1352 length:363 start_codon:yes stop_codon:yes gene_type:complete